MRASNDVSVSEANLVIDPLVPVEDGKNSAIPVAGTAMDVASTIPAWTDTDLLHWVEAGST